MWRFSFRHAACDCCARLTVRLPATCSCSCSWVKRAFLPFVPSRLPPSSVSPGSVRSCSRLGSSDRCSRLSWHSLYQATPKPGRGVDTSKVTSIARDLYCIPVVLAVGEPNSPRTSRRRQILLPHTHTPAGSTVLAGARPALTGKDSFLLTRVHPSSSSSKKEHQEKSVQLGKLHYRGSAGGYSG
jgi:hypothetical protein